MAFVMQNSGTRHYLDVELESLIQGDPKFWNFIRKGSLDGIWYWDLERPDQEWMSPEFWRLFGIDPETMPHSPDAWQEMIFPEDLETALENFNKHCADPSHPYDQIVRYKHADGSTVWVRCRGVAIRDADGRAIRMLGAHNDITAVKKAEEDARKDREIAKHVSEELRLFAYAVSHDMKSPANTIAALLNEINASYKDTFNDDLKSLVAMCEKTSDRMRNLIEDLLSFTRIIGEEEYDHERSFEQVDLNIIAEDVISDLKSDIEISQADISIDELPTVYAHPSQMRALLQNLISNAIKFRRPDVPPVISVCPFQAKDEGQAGITIRDNGIGIAKEHREDIFTIFTRLNLRDQYQGTGLGLAICKRIAMKHKGDILVDCPPSGGTEFTFKLPRTR